MSRSELENAVFNIEFENIKEMLWREIKAASTEDLEYYLAEYKAHAAFVSAVASLELKDR